MFANLIVRCKHLSWKAPTYITYLVVTKLLLPLKILQVDVISMVVDATHSPEDFDMEDEVEDEVVDSLVRLIDQGHVLNKSMSVTSYSYMRQV